MAGPNKGPNIRRPYQPQKKQNEHQINGDIRYPQVRITGDGIESRVVSTSEAQKIARDMGLDLVEISATAVPPVCKICDYGKFVYDLKKKRKEQDKKQDKSETKELRLTYVTDEHDIEFKVRHAVAWLQKGDKVKCVIQFRGRSIQHKDMGEMLLLKVATMLEEVGRVESLPNLDGNKMIMMVAPKKKKP